MKDRQYKKLFLPVTITSGEFNTNKENEKTLLLTRHAWVIYQIFMGDGGSKTERRHCIKSSQQGCESKACHRYGTTSLSKWNESKSRRAKLKRRKNICKVWINNNVKWNEYSWKEDGVFLKEWIVNLKWKMMSRKLHLFLMQKKKSMSGHPL